MNKIEPTIYIQTTPNETAMTYNAKMFDAANFTPLSALTTFDELYTLLTQGRLYHCRHDGLYVQLVERVPPKRTATGYIVSTRLASGKFIHPITPHNVWQFCASVPGFKED